METSTAEPTVREALAAYFRDNLFGEDGGYGDRWVRFELGRLTFAIPNTKARVRAVAYHDVHHLATGYSTDYKGEFEISAWELGAGCKGYAAAWVINVSGFAGGLLTCPRRTVRAFLRGRAQDTLYGRDLEQLLELPVSALAAATRARMPAEKPTVVNIFVMLLAAVVGLASGLVLGTLAALAAPALAVLGARAVQTSVPPADRPRAAPPGALGSASP